MNSVRNQAATTDSGTPGARRGRRRLLAVLLGIVPFVLLELGLRISGVGGEPTDLHVGFGLSQPLFEQHPEDGIYRTALAREQFFVAQEFPIVKPAGEFRIFYLGGSTVQGRPYRPETSFGKWLELQLAAADPSRRYRAINCGGISYASYRLRPVLREVLNYEPDLILLATGHNEFLEDRTYAAVKSRSEGRIRLENAAKSLRTVMVLRQLVGGAPRVEPAATQTISPSGDVEARLDDEDGYAAYHRDDAWYREVRDQFHDSVSEMLRMCQSADVPVVLIRLGANLRDCPPFKSEHRNDLSVPDQQKWQLLFDDAAVQSVHDPAAALALCEQALQIDDQYPLLHFRLARCYDRLGQFEKAAASYRRALDTDICPLRMTGPLSDQLIQLAEEYSVPLVDAATLVARNCPDGLPGYDSYIDHVHPTIGVHQQIGQAIAAKLTELGLVEAADLSPQDQRAVFRGQMEQLSPAYFSNGRRRIGWLEGWARRQRLLEETAPADTRGYIAMATRCLDLHDFDRARKNLCIALASAPITAEDFLRHAAHLFQQGRSDDCDWLLNELSGGQPDEKMSEQLDFARLVIAVERGHRREIETARDRHPGEWERILEQAPKEWSSLIPDLLQQID